MLFAAPVFSGSRLAAWTRALMIAGGVLELAGLSGVAAGDMQLRNIGIVGYVGMFLVVASLLPVLFYRATPLEARNTRTSSRRESLTPLQWPDRLEGVFRNPSP
jgi:hypothetical protein